MKTLLIVLGFGAFLLTGSWWYAVAVICLGLVPDGKLAKVASPTVDWKKEEEKMQREQNEKWQREQVREYHASVARQLRGGQI